MVDLSFAFSITGTYHLRFFAGKTKGAECTGGWTQFVSLSIHQYISSRKISANWRATATYVGNMWLCYGVHITVCIALLVCVHCQSVHSCIEPSLHQLDFF